MALYLLSTIIIITNCVFIYSETVAQSCAANEELVKCPQSCDTDYCPTTSNQTKNCIYTYVCQPSACKCRAFYRYASRENKTCIPTEDCPAFPCGDNEVFDPCPSYCSEQCADATLDGDRCSGLLGYILVSKMVVECQPTCRCIDEYWRNDTNQCVCYDDCPVAC